MGVMTKGLLVLLGLLCLIGTSSAMGSLNFNLSWNVIGGGGGFLSSPSYSVGSTVGQIAGFSTSTSYNLQSGFWVMDDTCGAGLIPLPGISSPPTDPDGDCLYEDLNANNRKDFNDVVVMFNQMQWIMANEPVSAFDFNGNARIDFNDIVVLFGEI
jgi:PKD repeat protein